MPKNKEPSRSAFRVLVTGANGFIGKNLLLRLSEMENFSVLSFVRGDTVANLSALLAEVDAVVHLAGVNRPKNEDSFADVNTGLTKILCDAILSEYSATGRKISMLFASSTQAKIDKPYGQSKLAAERAVEQLASTIGNSVDVFRLPGVFGKWCKPNYNSVVATFCYNIARGLPLQINDLSANVRLVYVDNVVSAIIGAIKAPVDGFKFTKVETEYVVTLGELANQIRAFETSRKSLVVERVGTGFIRELYATYLSYLPPKRFSYSIPKNVDERGVFTEMLKTPDAGQISFFTAKPGITRGGHYHNTKSEKFLVTKGHARFGFRHIITNEVHYVETCGEEPQIVESVPGWTHDVVNIGNDEMVVMLWASEIFDPANPDTFLSKIRI